MPIQFLLIVMLLSAIAVTWKRLNEHVITLKETILWTCLWLIAIVIVLLPNTTSIIAQWVGIGRGVDLVVYASIVGLFFLVFKIFVSLDALEHKLTSMVRKDALRELDASNEEQKRKPLV